MITVVYSTTYHQKKMDRLILVSGFVIFIFALVIVVFLVFFVRIIILKPIKIMSSYVRDLFVGEVLDLSQDLVINSKDEIGEMARDFLMIVLAEYAI